MKTKTFLASCAKATFALAAVVLMGAAFTSCSKDNNDDEPLPDAKPNTVVIDGKERPVLSAKYSARSGNDYGFWLYLDAAHNEYVYFSLNGDVHLTGKPFDLTKKEPKHKGYAWYVGHMNSNGKYTFEGEGTPRQDSDPVFNTGTLTMSGKPEGTISFKLSNGRIVGKGDKKEHTITLRYTGKMDKR